LEPRLYIFEESTLFQQIHAEEEKLVAHLGSIVYDLDRRLRGRRGQKKRIF
jgi:hypothetical protein